MSSVPKYIVMFPRSAGQWAGRHSFETAKARQDFITRNAARGAPVEAAILIGPGRVIRCEPMTTEERRDAMREEYAAGFDSINDSDEQGEQA